MDDRYIVVYKLYNNINAAMFNCATQYINFITVLEEQFNTQFEVISIRPFEKLGDD